MYGTVARMKVKPGQAEAFVAFGKEFDGQRRPKGYIGQHVYRLDADANEFILVVVFEDKESYHANANDPEQDKDYRQMRDMLEADPVWHDGEVVYSFHTS